MCASQGCVVSLSIPVLGAHGSEGLPVAALGRLTSADVSARQHCWFADGVF